MLQMISILLDPSLYLMHGTVFLVSVFFVLLAVVGRIEGW